MKKYVMLTLIIGGCLCALAGAADEPLWLRYPALSPDGTQVVFEYQGNLFIVATTGGTARQLTSHPARDFWPAWSPDGRSIAFSTDRLGNSDVFVVPVEGGTPTRLTFHSADDIVTGWTPDGQCVLFTSYRFPRADYRGFPSGLMTQLYKVDRAAHMPEMVLEHAVARAAWSADGRTIAYMDVKGYEDYWRKHHTSSVTRDVWAYDVPSGTFSQLTTFNGEDRDPFWGGGTLFYLSEESGSFNVWRMAEGVPRQVTRHETHPVRFATASADGRTIAYSFRGELWLTAVDEGSPRKIAVEIRNDFDMNAVIRDVVKAASDDMAVSPDGKEIAFVHRGEVFVTAVEFPNTRRITDTPVQERSVGWSPDGRTLYYAGERDSSWNIYKCILQREEEKHFYNSTLLREEAVLAIPAETFQPLVSPDGKKMAYLEERTILKVLDLESGESRILVPDEKLFSYSDGDVSYAWSPDSRWLAVAYMSHQRWTTDIGVVNVESGEIHNITNNGYSSRRPYWSRDGKQLLFSSDMEGLRSHGGHGAQEDVYAVYLSQADHDLYTKPEAEFADEKPEKKKDRDAAKEATGDRPEKADKEKKPDVEPVRIDFDGIRDRIRRLTINSSQGMVSDLSPDGETLVYFARSRGSYDLWVTETRKKSTKILVELNARRPGTLTFSRDGKSVFVCVNNQIRNVDPKSGKAKPVAVQADMALRPAQERAYIFEHAWRQVLKKFYVEDLHGVDWPTMKAEYARFLPHITTNADFAEMLSEMLGELNGSHTGCRYRPEPDEAADDTAELGLFFDPAYEGDGLKVKEVLAEGPFSTSETAVRPGEILLSLNGEPVGGGGNHHPLLNHMAGQKMVAVFGAANDPAQTREVVFKPLAGREAGQLLYKRWTENCWRMVDQLSAGRIGYVHVRGMNPQSFKDTFSEIFGRNADRRALVVDTRFNGGGWLHDDLCTLLGGDVYLTFVPRGKKIGVEPQEKWTRPVVVVMGEGNYSDAHIFPFGFKEMNLGQTVGMPVPGTGTAVWWERQIDPSLVFGIPQVGVLDEHGRYLENQQLEPDIRVANAPGVIVAGRDQQLEAAVKEVLSALK
ncbi:MAG: PD40 domain-containing protein [Acidobacteria bacterium]|nr:PD40 domain-containing protein [Acidobacteriota bacterium]